MFEQYIKAVENNRKAINENRKILDCLAKKLKKIEEILEIFKPLPKNIELLNLLLKENNNKFKV